MKGGYVGKILVVDLSNNSTEVQELPEEMYRNFLGGYGLGARILYSMMKPGIDPLGPDNIIGFVPGLLTGTGAPFTGRYMVVCKSPVTGGWNDANSGGFFGPELKKAGFDGVFIKGAAKEPVYLWIHDGKAEIRSAKHLWGLDSEAGREALRKETDPEAQEAMIGPAGEALSYMAAVMNDKHRAAGRGGAGAVMGSKKLKAVVVRGTDEVPVAYPERLKEVQRALSAAMKNSDLAKLFHEHGTGAFNGPSALSGDTPVKNWAGVGIIDFGEDGANAIAGPTLDPKYKVKPYGCANCPLVCGAHYEVKDGKWIKGMTERPEYETAASFGTLLLNKDAEAIFACNDICNRYGLDTISTGMTIAWAMECYEKGILTKEELNGLDLKWGNAEAIVELTKAIAEQKGIGKVLAKGSAKAADELGKGHECLITVKGIELPMHDPRLSPGYARTYQFDPTPGRHVKGGLGGMQLLMPSPAKYIPEGTGFLDVLLTTGSEVESSAGLCMFSGFLGMQNLAQRLIEAVTGWNFKGQDVLRTGARILNMRHVFNLREGFTPKDFVIPPRAIGVPPLQAGPTAGITINAQRLAENFFHFIGWDMETGKPSKYSLEHLGSMDDVIKDLYG